MSQELVTSTSILLSVIHDYQQTIAALRRRMAELEAPGAPQSPDESEVGQ